MFKEVSEAASTEEQKELEDKVQQADPEGPGSAAVVSPACWEPGFQAWALSTCPELSAQGLVPLRGEDWASQGQPKGKAEIPVVTRECNAEIAVAPAEEH